ARGQTVADLPVPQVLGVHGDAVGRAICVVFRRSWRGTGRAAHRSQGGRGEHRRGGTGEHRTALQPRPARVRPRAVLGHGSPSDDGPELPRTPAGTTGALVDADQRVPRRRSSAPAVEGSLMRTTLEHLLNIVKQKTDNLEVFMYIDTRSMGNFRQNSRC